MLKDYKGKEQLLEERKLRLFKKRHERAYNNLMKELNQQKKPEEPEHTTLFPNNKQVFIKAARGRGKSALLGLAISAAIAKQATNILLFAPKVENIQTVFQFIEVGLKQLGYLEHQDYRIIKEDAKRQLANITGIDIMRTHRQVVRYISPELLVDQQLDHKNSLISLADLLVIDEAAAMPVDLLRTVIDSETFCMISSTVHGYEGSGRALQIKVVNQLTKCQKMGKQLIQLQLETPIRYGSGDLVETWLYNLLLLDCEKFLEQHRHNFGMSVPLPEDCNLYMLSRDCLFSGEPATESFLKLVWSIFATSHYKNQPNDLMLVADNPTHRLFILVGPITDKSKLPMPLAVIHAAIEGGMENKSVQASLQSNKRDDGNMVPWVLAGENLDPEFGELVGVRTVRIASNPYFSGHGYGTKALFDLRRFYSGQMLSEQVTTRVDRDMPMWQPSGKMPPLMMKLSQLQPEQVDYTSVAFGLT